MPTSQEVFVNTVKSNFIPSSCTRSTSNGTRVQIDKGRLNKVRLRPRIANEHAESSREILDTVNSTTIVGQIFKASQDNINGVALTLESADRSTFDDFESYANSAALQAVWVKTGADEATLETTIVNSGIQSMALPTVNADGLWTDTVSSTDYTGYTLEFAYRQTDTFSNQIVSFFIGDGTNTKSLQLNVANENVWATIHINETVMTVTTDDLTANEPNIEAITQTGFRVDKKRPGSTAYVDDMVTIPLPGEIELKLWNLGSTLPVGDGASFDLTTDATQYIKIGDLAFQDAASSLTISLRSGGKLLYDIEDFIAGTAREIPINETLTTSNYYAITLHYVDTDVNIYGPNTTFSIDYYQSGYAFFTSAENVDITTISGAAGSGIYSDLMFVIYSTQKVYITSYQYSLDATPGNDAQVHCHLESNGMIITDTSIIGPAFTDLFSSEILRPPEMKKGAKFELYYSDDFTDSVTSLVFIMEYLYEPAAVFG